jgi:hypothetical protein
MGFPIMPIDATVELAGPTITFTDVASSSSNAFTYTFNTRAIGTATADRLVVVCAMTNAISTTTYSISSITINGVSATNAVKSSLGRNSLISYLLVPTGTTANIVVTLTGSGTPGRCEIGVFTVTGYSNAVPEAVGSAYSDTSVASLTEPINVSSGSSAIACCYVGNNGTSGATWTAPMTEAFDNAIESTTFTGAYTNSLPRGDTNVVITPPVSIDMSMSVVAWR